MRVYLPSTLPALRRLLDDGVLGEPPLPAYAVTGALREWYAEGDQEELEYTALSLAARASVRLLDPLLSGDPAAPARRVVVVAEVARCEPVGRAGVGAPGRAGGGAETRATVRVLEPVPLRDVQAVHVDDPSAENDVRAAAEAVVAADLGSDDALFAVEQADGHELQWFATQEIGPLLELG